MHNKISAQFDFETKIYDKPVELLKAIREHAIDYQETKYEISIIVDALKAMMTTKQREVENLAEYNRQFKKQRMYCSRILEVIWLKRTWQVLKNVAKRPWLFALS